jgi:MoxR-like ATPase
MTIIPKPYPQPNPDVPGSTSRFATGFISLVDENGNDIQKEQLKAVEPDLPQSEFKYDPDTRSGKFIKLNGTKKGRPIPPYIPSEDIKELVRLAQILQRPVLIKGEPGSGKTQLARSVAYEWYGNDYKNHFFEWQVKSTSKAVDGLYSFDHIGRLRDSQLNAFKEKSQYRTFGPMGLAFLTSTQSAPSILLIDEIDKADIDFPNDLLLELDERRFTIPDSETGEIIETRYPPFIFITSNDERELPEAFLRRCLFMYIRFPDDKQLKEIINAHLPGLLTTQKAVVRSTDAQKPNETFVDKLIERFTRLKKDIDSNPADNKRISTSELLDWLRGFQYDLENPNGAKSKELQHWISAFNKNRDNGLDEEFVKEGLEKLPFYHQALLKTYASVTQREESLKTSQ